MVFLFQGIGEKIAGTAQKKDDTVTTKQIKLELGKYYTENIAKLILESKSPAQALNYAKKSMEKIEFLTDLDGKSVSDSLKNKKTAKAFLENPEEFVRLATALSGNKVAVDNRTFSAGTFDRKKYSGSDGKLLVVQIVDKSVDDQIWKSSKSQFSDYKKTKETPNEAAYEAKNAKVVLYRGKDAQANQKFLKELLVKEPNMVLTLSSHSFTVSENMPPDIFGNRKGNILFIPNSGGSVIEIPKYLEQNPATNIEFIANRGPGRSGNLEAIVNALISTKKPTPYKEILDKVGLPEDANKK